MLGDIFRSLIVLLAEFIDPGKGGLYCYLARLRFFTLSLTIVFLDIMLVSSVTGKPLARPWATFLTDAYSRRILACYVTYDPPSYRSCMMIFRLCVQRYGRLPQELVVDRGPEFQSVYFESLLTRCFVTKLDRPAQNHALGRSLNAYLGPPPHTCLINFAAIRRPSKCPDR